MKDKRFYFEKENYLILLAAIVALVVGYTLMWFGSIVFSTIFLIAGYVFLIPLSILYKSRKKTQKKASPKV